MTLWRREAVDADITCDDTTLFICSVTGTTIVFQNMKLFSEQNKIWYYLWYKTELGEYAIVECISDQ